MFIIKNKVIRLASLVVLTGILVPTNVFVYATSDASYVEKVSSIVSVSEIPNSLVIENETETDEKIGESVVTDIAEVLGMEVKEEDTYSLVFGEELAAFDIVLSCTDTEDVLSERFDNLHEITSAELSNTSVIEILDEETKREIEEERKRKEEEKRLAEMQKHTLLQIVEPDNNYKGQVVQLTEEDRYLLEHLVMGEAGGEGMEGAALVTQAIRDTMVYKGFNSVADVRNALRYSGSLEKEPNENVKKAVSYIFDQGGCAVKHRIFYFYAPARVSSSFHESQHFVIEYKGHRFFSNN